ncbi:MAG TPA: hypothetical protein PL045_12035, partial [Chitinophagaceae bacterium]|nr:hypothetical protein [Chitinophagaceae bacterium]
SNIKPYPRRQTAQLLETADSLSHVNARYADFSEIDKYNLQNELALNSEWTKPRDSYNSRKPVLGGLYKTKSHLLEVNNKDLYLTIDPVVYFSAGKENDNDKMLFQNSRGLTVRGMIAKRVGFNLYFTDNQERDPKYVTSWIAQYNAVPGTGFYKNSDGTLTRKVDYFDARGSVSWNVTKFIDMQFGFDKNQIGAGYRSLFLSDFSQSATFIKINTRIWKFDYQNLYFELYPSFKRAGNSVLDRKYARMNYLSLNATKWLNVGVFEGVVFGRANHFDFQYLIPVMFIRPAESNAGSGDNAVVGFDAKANLGGVVQLYSQFLLDELKVKEIFKGDGWWGNKNGLQLGAKIIDVFGLKNLDLQLEMNAVRPFTYSHYDSIANYTHYNQPLAHPLGANFREFIAIIKAQPFKKLYLRATGITYSKGLDSAGYNFGSDIFRNYEEGRTGNYGYKIAAGDKAKCSMFQFVASYELAQNMFVDVTAFYRHYTLASLADASNTTTVSLTLRWNVGRRDFLF